MWDPVKRRRWQRNNNNRKCMIQRIFRGKQKIEGQYSWRALITGHQASFNGKQPANMPRSSAWKIAMLVWIIFANVPAIEFQMHRKGQLCSYYHGSTGKCHQLSCRWVVNITYACTTASFPSYEMIAAICTKYDPSYKVHRVYRIYFQHPRNLC